MKVLKSQAVSLLVALGIKNAGSWALDKILEKLRGIGSMKDAAKKIKDKAVAKLYADLTKKGASIELEEDPKAVKAKDAPKAKAAAKDEDEDADDEDDEDGDEDSDDDEEESDEEESDEEESEDDEDGDEDDSDEDGDEEESEDEEDSDDDEDGDDESEDDEESEDDDEEEEPKSKKNKDKGKKDKGKKEKKDKPKAAAVEKNEFGHRLDTRAARIDAAITAKPKTIKQIQDDAKYDQSIHNHMKQVVDRGFVIKGKNKDGQDVYSRAPKKGEKVKSKK